VYGHYPPDVVQYRCLLSRAPGRLSHGLRWRSGIAEIARHDAPPRNRIRDVSLAVLRRGSGPENQYVSYKPLDLSARIELGGRYDGCPYCRARGYFHCSKCELFSCWNSHNRKPHLDHSDIWCEGCRLWRCTRDKDAHGSLSKMTAYAAGEPKTGGGRRAAIESTARDQISRSTPLRGYLE
jgi:hypothetical protein